MKEIEKKKVYSRHTLRWTKNLVHQGSKETNELLIKQ